MSHSMFDNIFSFFYFQRFQYICYINIQKNCKELLKQYKNFMKK